MRWWLSLSLALWAVPTAAQDSLPGKAIRMPAPVASLPVRPAVWNPTAPYIAAGQDEAGYRAWIAAMPVRAQLVEGFNTYLTGQGVGGIVPTWQLIRTASMWRKCNAEPFEVPPTDQWPNMVETLRYVRDHVVPVVGPVEPVSVYRNETLNVCAGGAKDSAHRHLFAIDMVPLAKTTREDMMKGLCAIHAWQGDRYKVGLGFYVGLRFHVDSYRYRKWGAALGDERTVGCPHLMAAMAAAAAASNAANAPAAVPPALVPNANAPADPLLPK